ncbi:MAG: hypothetical protein ACKVOJ_05745 [Sphingomonadaceae bacterium]
MVDASRAQTSARLWTSRLWRIQFNEQLDIGRRYVDVHIGRRFVDLHIRWCLVDFNLDVGWRFFDIDFDIRGHDLDFDIRRFDDNFDFRRVNYDLDLRRINDDVGRLNDHLWRVNNRWIDHDIYVWRRDVGRLVIIWWFDDDVDINLGRIIFIWRFDHIDNFGRFINGQQHEFDHNIDFRRRFNLDRWFDHKWWVYDLWRFNVIGRDRGSRTS